MRNILGLVLIMIMTNINAFGQCAFNNTYYETVAAPTTVGATVTTLLYGGEYTTVTGMKRHSILKSQSTMVQEML